MLGSTMVKRSKSFGGVITGRQINNSIDTIEAAVRINILGVRLNIFFPGAQIMKPKVIRRPEQQKGERKVLPGAKKQ